MGAAEKLTRQTVVDKAVELADAEGFDAVTIRRLAQELGVTPMALYWHFKNKDLLLQGVADHVLAEVTPEFDPAAPWNARLRAMVEALLRVLRRHPSLTSIFSMIDKKGVESFTRATEAALDLLSQAGFTLEEGYLISTHLLHGAITIVDCQPGDPPRMSAGEAAEWRRQKRLALESLPAGRFPCLVQFARNFETEPDIEWHYAFGLDLLMSGVEAMAAQRAPSTATPNSTT
ncbi:TetR family transcriptional regulator [Planotetraspora sp. A-T 1434]|uniref:TetR/AcrR family transcriptional regulator n=1 Tax=Planotetraspora sp. A-T 1434 TaxID=2979219 RepID=UPI0021BFB40A|nr:TetR family transcriptional regulator [Planotetraspora sp. A-T 1434]MCT9934091.1 TetR family transcriptional regulator [Planotetraspora sp. A-T 1434]